MGRSRRQTWRNWIARLVIASLTVQLVTAAWMAAAMTGAHSAAAGPLSRTIVICTSAGPRRVTLDQHGNPIELPERPAPEAHCPICLALNQLQAAVVPTGSELTIPNEASDLQRWLVRAHIDDRRPHVRCGLDPPTSF